MIMNEEIAPVAEMYLVSSIGATWFNTGIRNDILKEVHSRWPQVKITVETEKLRWGSRDFHFHVRGPAVQVLLFTEMMTRYVL